MNNTKSRVKRHRRCAVYRKPNLNNMRGKRGRQLLADIRNLPVHSMDNLTREVDQYVHEMAKLRKHD